MGSRCKILFESESRRQIGVYAHSSGPERMAEAAMAVLENKAFKKRIGDDSYATRIGVQTVFECLGASSKDDTGFGLWTPESPDDNSYGIVRINTSTGQIFVGNKRIQEPNANKICAAMRT